jgi:hypothetical protein
MLFNKLSGFVLSENDVSDNELPVCIPEVKHEPASLYEGSQHYPWRPRNSCIGILFTPTADGLRHPNHMDASALG